MIRSMSTLLIATLTVLLGTAPAIAANEQRAAIEEALSHDGLQKIKIKGIDLAYARPGASLASYNQIIIDPVEVSFRKDWDPKRAGSRAKLSAQERENIRSGVARIVQEEFTKTLEKGAPYKVVKEAGTDVLRLQIGIADLYVNAPDTMSPGRSRTYTLSAGEMTLVGELIDSESGQVISRVIDRREARNTGTMQLTNSVVNAQEARAIAASWARILRSRLDAAHAAKVP